MRAILTQIAAVIAGIVLGTISMMCSRKHSTHFSEQVEEQMKFLPGAKRVAMHTLVGHGRLNTILLYRIAQVIANVWLPMAFMWVISPAIILPLWVLLYLVPPYLYVGVTLFSQPRYAVTPPQLSLLGVEENQKPRPRQLLFSALRPIIFLVLACLVPEVIVEIGRNHGLTDGELGDIVTNPVGYWRWGMQSTYGDIVINFTVITTILGTVIHIVWTLITLIKWYFEVDDCVISMNLDEELREAIDGMAEKIAEAAALDEKEDLDRVADLEVDTESKMTVAIAIALAIIDFFAYLYKLQKFLREGRYYLAMVMTFALVEALTTLVIGGHLQAAARDFAIVIKTGVPTVHTLACCQWDDGMAGIPSLWSTVYGLPLSRVVTPVTLVSSILFLCTGTRALAVYLQDTSDADMFGLPKEYKDMVSDSENSDEEKLCG